MDYRISLSSAHSVYHCAIYILHHYHRAIYILHGATWILHWCTCLHLYCTVSSFDDHTHHGTNLDVVINFPAGDSLFGKQVTCAGERIPSVHTLFIPPRWWKMVTRQYHILSARGNWISRWFNTVGGFDNIQRESSRAVCTSIISAPVSAGSISWFHWLWAVFGDGREQVGGCSPFNQ